MGDNVNQPAHYKTGGIETIDYIAAKLGPEQFQGYCLGNVMKYISRASHKNGAEDLRKAAVYLGWAINGNPERRTAPQVNPHPFAASAAPFDPPEGVLLDHKTAGELLASRQHEAAEGGEQSPCIGSVCGIGD